MPLFPPGYLRSLTTDVFAAYGAPPDEAAMVAEQLVASNLVGLDSHGVVRIPQYVDMIKAGTIKPGAPIGVVQESGGTAVVDCGSNFGQVGGRRAMQVAIDRAREHGVSCVVTRHCNHVGRLGYFTQLAAEAGLFALAACSSPKHGHFVVPFGGLAGRLATNPISYAAPGPDRPIVSDMSTSTAAEGKIRVYRNRGQKLPEGMIVDAAGRPTLDPADFYGNPRGWILPIGGALGYKGFALGLLVEILGTTLANRPTVDDTPDWGNGACFVVIDVSAFMPLERFRELVGEIYAYMKSTPPAPGFTEVMLPGEVDFRIQAQRERDGIPVDPVTWGQIEGVAQAVGVPVAAAAEAAGG